MPKKRERTEEKTLYEVDVAKLEHNIGTWNDLFCIVDEGKRKQAYARMIAKGEDLVNQYAWAIPNKRALNIAAAFSPLVEVMTPTTISPASPARCGYFVACAFTGRPYMVKLLPVE